MSDSGGEGAHSSDTTGRPKGVSRPAPGGRTAAARSVTPGYLDAEGYLHLTDRKAFTIIAGGVTVYPQEIDDVLPAHPAVLDVGVFDMPDPEYGEVVTSRACEFQVPEGAPLRR